MPFKANKQTLDIYLAGPRGFCAGVDRAILMVEEALKKYGSEDSGMKLKEILGPLINKKKKK